MSLAQRALDWAIERHGDQRYGDDPYAVHLRAVVQRVAEHGGSETAQAAAALHDVVEDTDVTREQVAAEFGEEIATLVAALTKPPRGTPDRLGVYFDGLRAAGPTAVLIKLADRLANVRASCTGETASKRLFGKYRDEMPLFRERLHRPGEHEPLWRELETLFDGSGGAS